jgi:hypothetical protein
VKYAESFGTRSDSRTLTNPNMYTKDVKVDITKLYHPR